MSFLRPLGRKGLYEIILTFFVLIVLLVSVFLFMQLSTHSTALYGAVREAMGGPVDAVGVKDALLRCHRIQYLDEERLDTPCAADGLFRGYRLTQLPLNGCEERTWDRSRGDYSQAVPFILAMERRDDVWKCLVRLEVLLP